MPQAQVQAVGIGSDRPLGSAAATDPINERVDLIKAQQGIPMMRKPVLALLLLAAPARAQVVSDIEVPQVIVGDADQGQRRERRGDRPRQHRAVRREGPRHHRPGGAGDRHGRHQPTRSSDRQFQTLEDLVDTVPGWYHASIAYTFPTPLVRGTIQAVQYLHDGLSMFEGQANTPAVGREMPLELVKRVEMITGPGGVLWGSNSLIGILNVITKDAEDVDGVEVGGGRG